MIDDKKNKKKLPPLRTRILFTILWSVTVVLIMAALPLPYSYRAPGKPVNADSIVRVEDGVNKGRGTIYITTVIYHRATPALYLYHFFNPTSDLIPLNRNTLTSLPMAMNEPDPFEVQEEEAIYRAKVMALMKMGKDAEIVFDGAQITAFFNADDSRENLHVGDIIKKIDNVKVSHQINIHRYLNSRKNKEKPVKVGLIRNGQYLETEVNTVKDFRGRESLGVFFQVHLKREKLPVKIEVDSKSFTGSSAGLPLYLEMISQLSDEGLKGDNKIAATGELSEIGDVRSVIGVKYKVRGAESIGCNYFICPADNYAEAEKEAGTIKVIPVRNINDSYDALVSLGKREK